MSKLEDIADIIVVLQMQSKNQVPDIPVIKARCWTGALGLFSGTGLVGTGRKLVSAEPCAHDGDTPTFGGGGEQCMRGEETQIHCACAPGGLETELRPKQSWAEWSISAGTPRDFSAWQRRSGMGFTIHRCECYLPGYRLVLSEQVKFFRGSWHV